MRILRSPSTARAILIGFLSSQSAGTCVADIIGAGIIPAGMEMMDQPAIHAAEAFVKVGYPLEADALLIVELDGPSVEVDELILMVKQSLEKMGPKVFASVKVKMNETIFGLDEKRRFLPLAAFLQIIIVWMGPSQGNRLSEVLDRMSDFSEDFGLRVANVFHAGDGNLHPLILYDANSPGELEKAEQFGAEILKLCVEVGGVLTGEHGVGVEKRDLMGEMFTEVDLNQQQRVKCADPTQQLNPGKVFPTLHRCAELGRVHIHSQQTRFPDLPRF